MVKVTAITPISHDGVLYNPGDTFECTAAQAKTLCGLNSAKMAGNAAETSDEAETAAKPNSKKKGQ